MGTESVITNLTHDILNASTRIPWTFNEKVIIIISYSTSIALSSTGNALVIIVFFVGSFRPNRSSEVRQYLTNLAVSDLLISLFCLPFTFTYILLWDWPFPIVFCPIVLSIQLLAVTASAVTNIVIGIDRFCAVIYPMKSRITRRRSGWVIGCIWTGSALFSSVQCFVSRAHTTNEGYTECIEKWDYNVLQISYTISVLLITYIIPLSVLTVTYSIIGIKLWKRLLPGEADEKRDIKHMKSKIKVIKMLSVIVMCFGVCWMPLQLFFVEAHISQFQGYTKLRNIIYVICHWTAMSNSFSNPVVYSFMNDFFKSDLRWIIYQKCCVWCYWSFHPKRSSYYSSNSRGSISNNLSTTLIIHNRHYNQKYQFQNNESREKKNQLDILLRKFNNRKFSTTSFDIQSKSLITRDNRNDNNLNSP